ncbi:MAG: PQQ-binding-like beta-propeller repeat protein, partial [Clostridiales bacterium]|nr:PQQ-binding-like beta-propeller repeat protein [Clostridiales bacterium]
SNINSEKKQKQDLKEVIYATLDGNIYFMDLDDGQNTRSPINVGSPHKGSVAIDPRGYPLLYAGQGIPEVAGKKIPIGYRIYSLIDQKNLYFINGMDKDAKRYWGAFDSGALIDASSDTFIECGENGLLYTGKLNTNFNIEKKTISIKPELVKYRYKSPISTKIGTENSPVVYKNYIYFADNNGVFQCVDLNTLKTVWERDVTDDTDSTPVLEETPEGVFIYTACEVDHHKEEGASYLRKLNAADGGLLWEVKVPCVYDSKTNGGALATPVVGKNDISNLVIYNIAKTPKDESAAASTTASPIPSPKIRSYGGKLVALDKSTGKVVWSVKLNNYCWSSPVAVYDKSGKSCLIVCDSAGHVSLLEGTSGKILDTISIGANIEASPAVYDDMIVIGTRGCKIWGISIK